MKKQLIFLLVLFLLSSCTTYYKFNRREISKFDLSSENYKNLQYYVDSKVIWENIEQNSRESKTLNQGKAISKSITNKALNELVYSH